jgi:hypothetical protein
MGGRVFPYVSGRRQFLTKALPLGTLFCLGCKNLMAVPAALGGAEASGQKPKFLDGSGMTVEDVYKFGYGTFVPLLQALAKDVGRERFVRMVEKASAENGAVLIASMAKDLPKRDMKAFAGLFKSWLSTPPFDKAIAYEFVENTEKVLEMKVTECLPARIWREANAADIGYAWECSGSDALAKAFNPKMKGMSVKNLMKGDGVCIERFVLEA